MEYVLLIFLAPLSFNIIQFTMKIKSSKVSPFLKPYERSFFKNGSTKFCVRGRGTNKYQKTKKFISKTKENLDQKTNSNKKKHL